jgi:hypothetical protein
MISFGELFVYVVYFAMAGYIMYLQHRVKEATKAGAVMAMVLHDIANGELEVERYKDGFRIVKCGTDSETPTHQRES